MFHLYCAGFRRSQDVEGQRMKDDQESKQALMRVYFMGRENARNFR
jgi:hypothetical protein